MITRPTDHQLLVRASKGDKAAFAELYDRHHRSVWGFLLKMSHDHTLTSDMTQEVFLEVLKYPDRFDPTRGATMETWLCAIARNLYLMHCRKTDRETSRGEPVPESVLMTSLSSNRTAFETVAIARIDVRRALSNLSLEQREVLVLADMEDHQVKEISFIIGISVAAVKSRLLRARENVRKLLI
ncbi:MAG: RNA polymerase sigma factor [Acidobacteria bacterium]|nr:RNA polymerase sigma factor [Acidobacteriota bacterium]